MERVSFLLEPEGRQLACLLNPETLQLRRTSGVRPRRSIGGAFSPEGLSDDPLVLTGGGTTELTFELLFDTSIPGSVAIGQDVRDLTRPLWALAEDPQVSAGEVIPTVRFLWGKAWNVPGVVTAVAERLEHFTADGVPRRSWLKMRMLRVSEARAPVPAPAPSAEDLAGLLREADDLPDEEVEQVTVLGEGGEASAAEENGSIVRLDAIAAEAYGDASWWRAIALFNDLADPLRVAVGTVLRLPPITLLRSLQ